MSQLPPYFADDPLWQGLLVLYRGRRYAQQANASAWEYGVSIDELLRAGLTTSDLRWYLNTQLVTIAIETTVAGDHHRSFRELDAEHLVAGCCFTLSAVGMNLVTQYLAGQRIDLMTLELPSLGLPTDEFSLSSTLSRQGDPPSEQQQSPLPVWDVSRKELSCGNILIKRFRGPAINQETILTVFQEEGWPERIDDPLPPIPEQDPKRRLHDAIKCLNRNHQACMLRFRGDGSGEGVLWERCQSPPHLDA